MPLETNAGLLTLISLTVQMVFSIIIPSYTPISFDAARKASLCTALTAGWVAVNGFPNCTITSVVSFNATGVITAGYAYFSWNVNPTVITMFSATTLRDNRVAALLNDITSVLGAAFPGSAPNCACNGIDIVTQPSTTAYNYSTNITVGPMQCGARLTYNSAVVTNVLNQVGIDDGSVTAANLGKFCSTPPVVGGVVGIPGSVPCRQYGVIASALGTTQAVVNNAGSQGVSILTGALIGVDFTGGNAGNGYSLPPAVTVGPPNPLGVDPVTFALTTGQPAGLYTATSAPFLPTSNGPYFGVPFGTITGSTCVDVGTGAGVNARCTGAVTVLTDGNGISRTGRLCTSDDFNNGALCGAAGAPGPCVTLTGTVITKILFPGSATTYCTLAPTVTLATNTLQAPVTAQVSASVGANGAIASLIVTSGGSGYRTNPTVTIAAPPTDQLGKLCSSTPIPTLSTNIAYPPSITAGVTLLGSCRPLGRNTLTNRVCSIPSVAGGEWNPLDTFTCNVQSSFINQPNATVSGNCGILSQSFVTVVFTAPSPPPPPPFPPPPPPSPTPTPTSTPTPSPTSTPNPTSRPTPTSNPSGRTCIYDGIYRIESYGCAGQYITYNLGSKSVCGDVTLLLRNGKQAPGLQNQWRLQASYTVGEVLDPRPIVAVGRTTSQSCKSQGAYQLAPRNEQPWIRLGGSAFTFRIQPINPYVNCNVVRIQAIQGDYAGNYLGYRAPCYNQENWIWGAKTSASNMQWNLRRVNY